jgi:ParB family chromosome partitioning protein
VAKKPALGRGLDELLGRSGAGPVEAGDEGEVRLLPIEWLAPCPYQPRRSLDPDALEDLTDSVRRHGVVQPVLVRPLAADRYELVAGERRWRAAQKAGLREIPAMVRSYDDRTVVQIALIENVQRADLSPLEEAQALDRLCREFGMTHEEAGRAVGRSRAAVSNLLRLLDLDDEVQREILARRLDMGHARALLPLPRQEQRVLARRAIRDKLSVRRLEALVRAQQKASADGRPRGVGQDPDLERVARVLGERLGARVEIVPRAGGGGYLRIHYASLAAFDELMERLSVEL